MQSMRIVHVEPRATTMLALYGLSACALFSTTSTFVRSGTALGDYEVPEGRYGVQQGELLRIECNTGEVVGIVRR